MPNHTWLSLFILKIPRLFFLFFFFYAIHVSSFSYFLRHVRFLSRKSAERCLLVLFTLQVQEQCCSATRTKKKLDILRQSLHPIPCSARPSLPRAWSLPIHSIYSFHRFPQSKVATLVKRKWLRVTSRLQRLGACEKVVRRVT